MISTQQIIYCINPDCTNPRNPIGSSVCASCQTPLVHRYLWASGSLAAKIPPGTKVAGRYEVRSQKIWLDTQPGLLPDLPQELPKKVIPYLRLYQEHWHIPQAYGFVLSLGEDTEDILLLENAPINATGNIYPAIADAWEQATPVRQVYWLWQILQLWQPLLELGVARSLLLAKNLRSLGWCVRLLELVESSHPLSLRDLALSWQPLVASAKTPIAQPLKNIVRQMAITEVDFDSIATQLNALLLSAAAELPLTLKVAGGTDTGPQLKQNEDTCYPSTHNHLNGSLLPGLAIVCDGIGGHQGGEVASQLAVQSMKLQIPALLAEVAAQTEIVLPNLLQEQLEAGLRVVNNLICSRNDEQKRHGRERMATTLVMAVQVPQRVLTTSGRKSENAHELYLASVGDSRAYWITRTYCQLLTIDDDVATREVRYGRSLYRQALQRADATALTQALGTRDAESLRLAIKRFIIEEDGILLLCSDGLSDHDWVEKSWQDYAVPILTGEISVKDAVRNWINLANEKNGHDNTSVVITLCRVSPEYLIPVPPPPVEIIKQSPPPVEIIAEAEPIEAESALMVISPATLDLDLTEEPSPTPAKKSSLGKRLIMLAGLLTFLLVGASLGLFAWWQINPQTFQQMCRQLPQRVQQLCPQSK